MKQTEIIVYFGEPFHQNAVPGTTITLGDSYTPMTVTWISPDRRSIKLVKEGES